METHPGFVADYVYSQLATSQIIAIDQTTGEILWSEQIVPYTDASVIGPMHMVYY